MRHHSTAETYRRKAASLRAMVESNASPWNRWAMLALAADCDRLAASIEMVERARDAFNPSPRLLPYAAND